MRPKRPKKSAKLPRPMLLALLVAVLCLGWLIAATRGSAPVPAQVPLSQALSDVHAGKVTAAQVDDATTTLTLSLAGGKKEQATYPYRYSETLTQALLSEHGVKVETTKPHTTSLWVTALFSYGPMLLLLGAMVWLLKSGAMGGISKITGGQQDAVGAVPATRFADVAGCDEAVADLREIVAFLQDSSKFTSVGARLPRGALLVGPPGTGKTLLARAVAGEAGVPFFALSGSDLNEVFIGVGARRVRDVFRKARKTKHAVVFIDEIDSIGKSRSGLGYGSDERENTLLSLLEQMDGFTEHNVIVLAATNRGDVLDPALTRPGRFDRKVHVGIPDRAGREAILRVHLRGRPLGVDVDVSAIARRATGFSGAELARLVNEASIEAGRRGLTALDQQCFSTALATVTMGRARTSAVVSERDRAITAWHEAGHALVALLEVAAADPVHVSIVPRGAAGGVTWMDGSDDVYTSRTQANARLAVALGGRVGEEIHLGGDCTQGAHSDLSVATKLATAMVTQYGMTDLGMVCYEPGREPTDGPVARRIDEQVRVLLNGAYDRAVCLLNSRRTALQALADALLDEEELSGQQVAEIVAAN